MKKNIKELDRVLIKSLYEIKDIDLLASEVKKARVFSLPKALQALPQ